MRGTLTPDTLARVLRGIALSRKEGILHLSSESVSKRVYFKGGSIIFAGSDDEQERLGEVLVRAGKLERPDLELALRVMKQTGESLGKTVVEMGFTSFPDISAHALERTKSIIASVFLWQRGTFYFEERPTTISDEMALDLSATEAILAAVRNIAEPEIARRGIGDLKAVLRQPTNPLAPSVEGSLSSSVEWLLFQANGVSTIEEIVRSSPLDEERTLRSIYALVLAGILEKEDPSKAMAARAEWKEVVSGSSIWPSAWSESTVSSPAPPPADPIPARLGRYEVERLLGRGAMGAVYLARDPAIERTVAVKLIQTTRHLDPTELEKYRERFYREAKSAGKLLHPGIVTVFDVGHTEESTPFIVMEYVEGKTLAEILKARDPHRDESLRITSEILDALAFAHSRGIVHRDIKPANILVTPEGQVKIMDFGIAHVVGSELTQADDVLGSPNYMAPEQLSKGTIDARTDLFAVGVVLYRMLGGCLPFTGDSFAAIASAILSDEPQALDTLDPALPSALSSVVLRSLAKDPARRFSTALELKRALLSPPSDLGLPAMETAASPGGLESATPRHLPTHAQREPVAKASSSSGRAHAPLVGSVPRSVLWGGAALVLGLASFAAFTFSGRDTAPDAASRSREVSKAVAAAAEPEAGEFPSPAEAPSDAVQQAPSDAELFHQGTVALDRGDLETSRAAIEELLRRNPAFDGAAELLVKVNERLRTAKERKPKGAGAPTPPAQPAKAAEPTHAELYYRALLAFEKGDIEGSKRQLEEILRADPTFAGASALLAQVNDELWKKALPLSFPAEHKHRIGGCAGTLTLDAWGVGFSSAEHDWRWKFDEILVIERQAGSVLNIETRETEVLALGRPKNYKFELKGFMMEADWERYQRLSR